MLSTKRYFRVSLRTIGIARLIKRALLTLAVAAAGLISIWVGVAIVVLRDVVSDFILLAEGIPADGENKSEEK